MIFLLMVMPLVSVVLIVVDMFLLSMGQYDNFNAGQFFRMAVMLVIVNIAVFVILEKYTDLMKREMELIQEKTKLQSDAYLMEIAIVISNLLENAINACRKIPETERYLKLTAKYKNQLLLEIENSCDRKVVLDEDGYPCSRDEDHGIGTRSVLAFVNKTDSEICYFTEGSRFMVRMII